MNIENKIRYLGMIQGIIKWTSNNSFLLKELAITLIVTIFTLSKQMLKQEYFLCLYTSYCFLFFKFLLFAIGEKI
ncbi:hypothetical protein [Thomasclavelia cocleata]|uniref:hypothetical protein n=1 Tax=Thomasclavelia cocleata TaxID=69824 RepID=UPI002431515B|nr:hypothetical protein [Thomasclavelia cocleata]